MSFADETFEGAVKEPKVVKNRTPFAVLESLTENPLEQARKFVEYANACDDRKAKLAHKLSTKSKAILAEHYGLSL